MKMQVITASLLAIGAVFALVPTKIVPFDKHSHSSYQISTINGFTSNRHPNAHQVSNVSMRSGSQSNGLHHRPFSLKSGFKFKKGTSPQHLQVNSDLTRHLRDTKLLSADEEQKLGNMVQDMFGLVKSRRKLAARLQRQPTIEECASQAGVDTETYRALLCRGDWAKQTLVARNLRLVVSMSSNFRGKGIAMSDLVQDGVRGLIRAAEKYDPSLGFRFSTYATWWVRQRLLLAVQKHRLIRIPGSLHKKYSLLRNAVRSLAGELGRRPTEDEIAEYRNISVEQVNDITLAMMSPNSLDQNFYLSTNSAETQGSMNMLDMTITTEDMLNSTSYADSSTIEDALEWTSMRDDLETTLFSSLSKREREIVRMRVGLGDGKARSAVELSEVFQVPAYVILREERNALLKLRVSPGGFRLQNYGELLSTCS